MELPSVHILDQTFHLHPDKAMFWEEESILLLADLHLGKGAHFRKEGIAVPANIIRLELKKIAGLIDLFQAARVIFLGDLFHSVYNPEWEIFGRWMVQYPEISFELVLGNHDILSVHQYHKYGISLHTSALNIQSIVLSHHPMKEVPSGKYNLAGHIHPGVRMVGPAKQYLKLACYFFKSDQGLLPAFGAFTGLCILYPKGSEQVFVIAENEVMKV